MNQALKLKEEKQTRWKEINDVLAMLIDADVNGYVDTEERREEWKREFKLYARLLCELADEMGREPVVTFDNGEMAGIWYYRFPHFTIQLDDQRSMTIYNETAEYDIWSDEEVEAFLDDHGGYYC